MLLGSILICAVSCMKTTLSKRNRTERCEIKEILNSCGIISMKGAQRINMKKGKKRMKFGAFGD